MITEILIMEIFFLKLLAILEFSLPESSALESKILLILLYRKSFLCLQNKTKKKEMQKSNKINNDIFNERINRLKKFQNYF